MRAKKKKTIQHTNSTPTLISLIIKEIELGGLVAAVFSPREVKPFALFDFIIISSKQSKLIHSLGRPQARNTPQFISSPIRQSGLT